MFLLFEELYLNPPVSFFFLYVSLSFSFLSPSSFKQLPSSTLRHHQDLPLTRNFHLSSPFLPHLASPYLHQQCLLVNLLPLLHPPSPLSQPPHSLPRLLLLRMLVESTWVISLVQSNLKMSPLFWRISLCMYSTINLYIALSNLGL